MRERLKTAVMVAAIVVVFAVSGASWWNSQQVDEVIAGKNDALRAYEKNYNRLSDESQRMYDNVNRRVGELLSTIAQSKKDAKREKLRRPEECEAQRAPAFTDMVQISLKGVVHLQCPSWQGSGFVVGPRLIVTARHVVKNVEDFLITTHRGCQIHATRAISDKKSDIAFIWVDDLECTAKYGEHTLVFRKKYIFLDGHKTKLTSVPLGSIKDCRLGQNVYVIGSPYGKVNFNSLTTGVISGVNVDWSPLGEHHGWKVAFTVDSAGHPGNSGCPVFTTDGVVRGILVGRFSPVLLSVMPCDLFLEDLPTITLMFKIGQYQFEITPEWNDPYYNYAEDTDYYEVE